MTASQLGRVVLALVVYGFLVALVTLPLTAERAIENASFQDKLGTLPVEVSLAHNDVSTIDTGVLGKLYWSRTGVGGFGASLRSTGPPEAGGTLTSYVSQRFLKANVAMVSDPGEVARVYGAELRSQVVSAMLVYELIAFVAGGIVLTAIFHGRSPLQGRRLRVRLGATVALVALGTGASGLVALRFFDRWDGSTPVTTSYAMPGVAKLSFSSPQTREVAQQIQPFVEKMTTRIEARGHAYEDAAELALATTLPAHAAGLRPLDGEHVVIAEADPQGSLVATRVRTSMYPLLEDVLGDGSVVLRTISGDVSSNGAVAEDGYIAGEADASPDVPAVAVKGDHDSTITVEQLVDRGVEVPDMKTIDVGDLRVSGAADPAFKALFGGLINNDSGTTEAEIGETLRATVTDDPVIVLLHQPRAVAGFLGIGSTHDLWPSVGHETTPWDDGVPDVPSGSVNYGHLHDANGPWVIWNTDGDLVSWTVVSQLGTSGGVEENPTFNRFSTPFSVPLKAVSVRLQYINDESGLQTGYASVVIATDGSVTVTDRVDLGLPGGQPVAASELTISPSPDPVEPTESGVASD